MPGSAPVSATAVSTSAVFFFFFLLHKRVAVPPFTGPVVYVRSYSVQWAPTDGIADRAKLSHAWTRIKHNVHDPPKLADLQPDLRLVARLQVSHLLPKICLCQQPDRSFAFRYGADAIRYVFGLAEGHTSCQADAVGQLVEMLKQVHSCF